MARIYARATNLRFAHAKDKGFVIKSLEIDVTASQVVTIEGESGSGKSSILNFLLGDQRLVTDANSRRSFEIAGATLDPPQAKRTRKVAFLGDEAPFLPWCSVAVSIARQARYLGLSVSSKAVESDPALSAYGLNAAYARKKPSELSFGQKRRFALYSALRYEPEILLIDEIFKGLDARNSEVVAGIVVGYVRKRAAAAIIAVHEPRYIESQANARYGLVESEGPLNWVLRRISVR